MFRAGAASLSSMAMTRAMRATMAFINGAGVKSVDFDMLANFFRKWG
jgi:hypothetical protein